MALSKPSSASTVRAIFCARARTRRLRAVAVSNARCRGDGAKNTNPTMSAPASSAASSASGVERPQIFTMNDIRLFLAAALLQPPARFVLRRRATRSRDRRPQLEPLRRTAGALDHGRLARRTSQRIDLCAQIDHLALQAPCGRAPPALPQPCRGPAEQHADNEQQN